MLITRFMTPDGVGEVLDFMPVIEGKPTDRHQLVRHLRVARGTMKFVLEIQPRFDYGRSGHTIEPSEVGAVFRAENGMHLTVPTAGQRRDAAEGGVVVERAGDGLRATLSLREGESGRGMVLESMGGEPRSIEPAELDRIAEDTAAYWKSWLGRSTYTGRWREMVNRSAMTLKLLTYDPTGAPVAAATFGLPEQPGGERNWDYRYTWIRDGSFSVHALLGLGYTDEAHKFVRWLADRLGREHIGGNGRPPLDIMYRVDGASSLEETFLDHFEGWQNSSPVRVGNAASDQLQLDIYGESFDAFLLADQRGIQAGYDGWRALRSVTEWLCDNWDRAEEGIWETRGGQQHFTYGRVMSWVAFDRAIRIANHRGLPADTARWSRARDAVYEQIMERGWSEKRQAFVQHYDTTVLDASLLYMPLVGLISPRDPRWTSTLHAMDDELVSDSLVYRYDPSASPDGLRGHE